MFPPLLMLAPLASGGVAMDLLRRLATFSAGANRSAEDKPRRLEAAAEELDNQELYSHEYFEGKGDLIWLCRVNLKERKPKSIRIAAI
jgi:hypothetical protein